MADLIRELRTLTGYLNRFFAQSFTPTGRLKVVNIPVAIGDAAEAEQQYVSSITRIPTLLENLTAEMRQAREALERTGLGQPRQGSA